MALILITVALGYSVLWLFRSYQIGIKHQLNLVNDWGGKPLPNPENYRTDLAFIYLIFGLVLATSTATLALTQSPLKNWWVLVAVGQCYVIAHNFLAWRAKKSAA